MSAWFTRILCKFGFHSVWYDTVGRNIGTDETPVYFMETVAKCHNCSWQHSE